MDPQQIANKTIEDEYNKLHPGNNNTLVKIDVGRALKKTKNSKFTPLKRKKFLEYYAKTGNFSQSAINVKLSRQTVYEYLERDENFKKAFQFVEDHITDTIEQISLQVSLQPDHKGYNDRKLMLTARRPGKYNPKQDPLIEINISQDNYIPEVRRILSQYVRDREKAIDAKYTNVSDNNDLEDK